MAASGNATLLADLFTPEVVADYIDKKLIDAIRFAPLAKIDSTLVGRPGDEVTLPQYTYASMAEEVGEGEDIPIAKLSQTLRKVKIYKIGRAIEFSDEAMLTAYDNDIAEEAARQVLVAINDKIEADLLTQMGDNAVLTSSIGSSDDPSEGVADALTKFGEDIDGEKVLLIPPAFYARLRKSKGWIPNTELGAEAIIRGTIGQVHGCQVVVSNRLASAPNGTFAKTVDVAINPAHTYYIKDADSRYVKVESPKVADIGDYYERTGSTGTTAYIVKPGALAIFMKRDTMVEFDRKKLSQMNQIIGSKIFAPYVYDTSKLIKVALSF